MNWIVSIAASSLVISTVYATWIALGERRKPQRMAIMNVVRPVTARYAGPLALWAYRSFGRADDRHVGEDKAEINKKLSAASIAKATTHCGAGCTVGDIIAEILLAIWPGMRSPLDGKRCGRTGFSQVGCSTFCSPS